MICCILSLSARCKAVWRKVNLLAHSSNSQLNHRAQVPRVCVVINNTIVGQWRIIWTAPGYHLSQRVHVVKWPSFIETSIKIKQFSLRKMHLKMSSNFPIPGISNMFVYITRYYISPICKLKKHAVKLYWLNRRFSFSHSILAIDKFNFNLSKW